MPDIGPAVDEDGYPEEVEAAIEQYEQETGQQVQMGKKMPGKKEVAALEKAAQGLYLVETRARYGDVMVSSQSGRGAGVCLYGATEHVATTWHPVQWQPVQQRMNESTN